MDDDLPSTLVEEYLIQKERNVAASDGPPSAVAASVELPPGKQKSVDEVLAEMKRVPLFMNSMDDIDEDNDQLEALRALVYEGTRAEVAENFKNQGNELVQMKKWLDAREYYTKGIQVLKGPVLPQDPAAKVVEIDEEAEQRRERALAEACHANRALCHLEMSTTNPNPNDRRCPALPLHSPPLTRPTHRKLRLLQP